MTHISGHEPAEQMVSVIFQGIELSLRLGSEGIKTLAQMIYASTQKESSLNMRSGRVRQIAKLLKENKPLVTEGIPLKHVTQFKKLSKRYGILYALVKDTKSDKKRCTIIVKKEEAGLLQDVLHAMDLKGINPEKEDKKKDSPSKKVSKDLKKNIAGNEVKTSVLSDLEKNKRELSKSASKVVKTITKPKEIGK